MLSVLRLTIKLFLLTILFAQYEAKTDDEDSLIKNVDGEAEAVEKPLFLTPLIEKGQIATAQRLARVKSFLSGPGENVKSYSGYLTVDKVLKSHLYFWFFPKTRKNNNGVKKSWKSSPLVIWLQGGPGSTSIFALFTENGPYQLKKMAGSEMFQLANRSTSWSHYYNLLYIDNPVGAGYSFTEAPNDEGYVNDQPTLGRHLHEMLRQFLLLFPALQRNEVILTGESYAGKYLPTFANAIYEMRNRTRPSINLTKVFLGNPMISAEHMLTHYSEYLYAYGLFGPEEAQVFRNRELEILGLVNARKWTEAAQLFEQTFFDGITKLDLTFFEKLTGVQNHYHLMKDKLPASRSAFAEFVRRKEVKKALHVGNQTFFSFSSKVYQHLKADVLKSHKRYFENMLERYKVLVFSGQFDIICPYYVNEFLFRKLSWSGSWRYYTAPRIQLYWGEQLSGFVKVAHNFVEVVVRNAGHMVPTDRPNWTLDLLRRFVDGEFYATVDEDKIYLN